MAADSCVVLQLLHKCLGQLVVHLAEEAAS